MDNGANIDSVFVARTPTQFDKLVWDRKKFVCVLRVGCLAERHTSNVTCFLTAAPLCSCPQLKMCQSCILNYRKSFNCLARKQMRFGFPCIFLIMFLLFVVGILCNVIMNVMFINVIVTTSWRLVLVTPKNYTIGSTTSRPHPPTSTKHSVICSP